MSNIKLSICFFDESFNFQVVLLKYNLHYLKECLA